MKKLKHLFYTSIFGEWYFLFLLWVEDQRIKKKRNYSLSDNYVPNIIKNDVQMKYEHGVGNIKRKIQDISKKTNKNIIEILENQPNLINLATDEDNYNKEEYIQRLREVYIYKNKDIRNNTDKAKMINKRIKDFDKLKLSKEKRNLSRKIRLAIKEKNTTDLESLNKEWNKKYGKNR